MRTIVAAGGLIAGLMVAAGCATTGQSAPAPSPNVTPTESAETPSPTTSPGPTDIAPSSTQPPAPPQEPGEEQWPPVLALGDIKEAGTAETVTGGLRIQVPSGFTTSPTEPGTYISDVPGRSGSATISMREVLGTGSATDILAAGGLVARIGEVTIPGATSAAIGDAYAGGQQTWVLMVVTSSGEAVQATFTAAESDFDFYLLYQSVCSAQVV